MPKTKIVATLGPASTSAETIERLIRNGADVVRLNFSHGSHVEHANRIESVRAVSRRTGKPVGILADLQGPKIRTGPTEGDRPVHLRKGATVTLTSSHFVSNAETISVDYHKLAEETSPGQKILLNDGAVALRVESIDLRRKSLQCVVLNDGVYSSHKGVNLPGVDLRIPSLTPKDRADLSFALEHDVNFVALSFVRRAADLAPAAAIIERSGKPVKLIAKIEKPQAAREIDSILASCDGIMIARGDLGVETSPAEVPVLQKRLVTAANERGKLVIVATQMLESMIERPLPTRAEASDVANAIIDGADAVMLSGETAVGTYPAESVQMMARIAEEIERSGFYRHEAVNLTLANRYPPHALCEAAAWASRDLAAPVVVFTLSGATALYLSKLRNREPIYALSPDQRVVSMLSLAWNITPLRIPFDRSAASLQRRAEKVLLQHRFVKAGDIILILGGTTAVAGATNFLTVKKIGEKGTNW